MVIMPEKLLFDVPAEPLFDDKAPAMAPIEPMTQGGQMRRLGEKIPRGIYLGSSSWNFPGWRGLVWSPMSGEKKLAEEGLAAYSHYPVFRTVGIDRGFYRPLTEEHYRKFADQVPDNFRFLVKAPQSVTDFVTRDDRGRPTGPNPDYLNVEKALETFLLPVLAGLGEKAGPLVFEFSALPREAISDVDKRIAEIERLAKFFSDIKTRSPKADALITSEMRTARLLTKRYVNELRSTGARPVISLHPTMPDIRRQIEMLRYFDAPECPVGPWKAQGDIVVRWSLSRGKTYKGLKEAFKPFDRIQIPDIVTREGIAWLMQLAVKSGVRGFTVANNKAEGSAPLTMRAIAERITDYRVTDPDLPPVI